MGRPRYAAACALALAILFAGGLVGSACAAGLGGLRSASLLASSYPIGAVLDAFTGTVGSSLAGRADLCGDAWHVLGGTMTITSGQSAVSTSAGLVTASVPLCRGGTDANEEVGGDIHSTGSSLFGLLLHAQPGGLPATAAVYSNAGAGSLQIERIGVDGSITVWASVTGTGGGNIPRFLDFSYVGGLYQASINNVPLLTYLVTPAQRATVEANNEIGLVAVNDTRSTFDNLQAYPR